MLIVGGMFLRNIQVHDDQFVGATSGDEAYAMSRALRMRDIVRGWPTTKYDYFVAYDEYGRNSFTAALTGLQLIFGPTPYSLRLLNALLFLCGALLLFRVAYRAFGRVAAFGGLLVVLFWPSLFVWSISLLKEPLYFLCGAVAVTCAVTIGGDPRWRVRAACVAATALAWATMRDLRPAALVLAVGGLATGILLFIFTASKRAALVAVAGAIGAAVMLSLVPPLQRRVVAGVEAAAKVQMGHVFTVGHAYKLLDAGFYVKPATPAASSLTLRSDEAARFVVRGLLSFVLVPLPWDLQSARELAYLPEQLAWYALVVLMPLGAWAALGRGRLAACMLMGYAAPTAVVLASGGFEANAEMRTRYLGPDWELAKVRGTRHNTGEGIRIGTVDTFQGQEAPVAIYSMATSSPADAPRDFDFLYSGNRLNVAISRARGLAVLVCSPELLDVSPRTPEQLRLANALCRLVEVALEQDGETQEQIAQTGASGDEPDGRRGPPDLPGTAAPAVEQLAIEW